MLYALLYMASLITGILYFTRQLCLEPDIQLDIRLDSRLKYPARYLALRFA
jgi:hypothetical protein